MHVSTIGKKFVKQQYLLQMSQQYGELRPTSFLIVLIAAINFLMHIINVN